MSEKKYRPFSISFIQRGFKDLYRNPTARFLTGGVLYVGVYYLTSKLGSAFVDLKGFYARLWHPTGISIAASMVFGVRIWPFILIGSLLVGNAVISSQEASVIIAIGNTLGAILAAQLYNRLRKKDYCNIENIYDAGSWILSVGAGCLLSTALGVSGMYISGLTPQTEITEVFKVWLLIDCISSLTITALIVSWVYEINIYKLKKRELLELFVLYLLLAGFSYQTFAFNMIRPNATLQYLLFPLIIWLALRFSIKEVLFGTSIVMLVAIFSSYIIRNSFSSRLLYGFLFEFDVLLLCLSLTGLLLSIIMTERVLRERKLIVLSETSDIMRNSVSLDGKMERLAALLLPNFGDCSIIEIFHNNETQTYAAHVNPELISTLKEYRAKFPNDFCVPPSMRQTDKDNIAFYSNTHLSRYIINNHPFDKIRYRLLRKLKFKSFIYLPIELNGVLMGQALIFFTQQYRTYDFSDLHFGVEICRRGAIALQNADLMLKTEDAVRARDEFISIASHELRSPLTALSLNLQMGNAIASEVIPPCQESNSHKCKKAFEMSQLALTKTLTIHKMVDELLDLSHIRRGNMEMQKEPLNISELLVSLAKECITTDDMEKLLQFHIQPNVTILADKMRLEQVIRNLLSNAVKYGNAKPIEIKLSRTGNFVIIDICDNGIGIDPSLQKIIFNRFERAAAEKTKIQGLGLGLYICQQIIRAHGGTISVQSQMGLGSVFSVKLPVGNNNAQA